MQNGFTINSVISSLCLHAFTFSYLSLELFHHLHKKSDGYYFEIILSIKTLFKYCSVIFYSQQTLLLLYSEDERLRFFTKNLFNLNYNKKNGYG